jgi:hypothetical protein
MERRGFVGGLWGGSERGMAKRGRTEEPRTADGTRDRGWMDGWMGIRKMSIYNKTRQKRCYSNIVYSGHHGTTVYGARAVQATQRSFQRIHLFSPLLYLFSSRFKFKDRSNRSRERAIVPLADAVRLRCVVVNWTDAVYSLSWAGAGAGAGVDRIFFRSVLFYSVLDLY